MRRRLQQGIDQGLSQAREVGPRDNLDEPPVRLAACAIPEQNRNHHVEMRLEVVVVPVTDVDRAKTFYRRLGWRLDIDETRDDVRFVQITPPGSSCSIVFGTNLTAVAPGNAHGLHLVVTDIEAARAELGVRGADVSESFHDTDGIYFNAGTLNRSPGLDPQRRSYASFATFDDPDGNSWLLQEITQRLPGR